MEPIPIVLLKRVGLLAAAAILMSACAGAEPMVSPGAAPSASPTGESAFQQAATPAPMRQTPVQVEWSEAERAIRNGQVKQATQTHARQVILRLKDGQTITTTEPALDDVFAIIRQCGERCADILIASE